MRRRHSWVDACSADCESCAWARHRRDAVRRGRAILLVALVAVFVALVARAEQLEPTEDSRGVPWTVIAKADRIDTQSPNGFEEQVAVVGLKGRSSVLLSREFLTNGRETIQQ